MLLGYQHAGWRRESAESAWHHRRREYPLEVRPAEFRHWRPGDWTVESDNTGKASNGIEQCSDIRKADQWLGPPGDRVIVHAVQKSQSAVAASNAPDCIDGGVAKNVIQVSQALVVGSSQVTMPAIGICT